jgi:heme-degrading monooxygenase HmoA
LAREHYASGNWLVRDGTDEDFISRWRDWIGASTKDLPGFGSAALIRDDSNPRHFLSFSAWDDPDSRDRWKASAEFEKAFQRCRELCEEFSGGDFTQVVSY